MSDKENSTESPVEMSEKERCKRLIRLLSKLNQEGDVKSIEFIKTMTDKDTPAIKFGFEMMFKENDMFSQLFLGTNKIIDGIKPKTQE